MSAGIVSWGVYLPYWRLQRSAIAAVARLARRPGHPHRRLLRRGHHHHGGRGGPTCARRARGRASRRPLLLHTGTGVPRQDERVGDPRRARPARGGRRVRPRRARCARVSPRCDRRRGARRRGAGRWPWCRTSAPASPARPTSATAATGRWRSCSATTARWPRSSPRRARRASSSTGGARRARRSRSSGRSGSARRSTCPWSRRRSPRPSKDAGVSTDDVDHLIVAGLHARAVKATAIGARCARRRAGRRPAAHASATSAPPRRRSCSPTCSNAPTPGQLVAVVVLADGADVTLLRTTAALVDARATRDATELATVGRASVDAGRDDLPYARFLTWRGELRREPPRRPDPERPGAPATWRSTAWRSGFEASRCLACGFRHLPPTRVCLKCGRSTRWSCERLADVQGRGGDVHDRPPGVQPVAAGGRRGRRLRRRRPLPLRDDRRRPRRRSRSARGSR